MSDEATTIPAGIPAVGEVIAAKYRVERVLGVGGMGVVLAAQHLRLEESVAIKILLPELARNQEVVERFMREARAAARIKNQHVGRVFDVEMLESGPPYMVMECLEGADLKEIVAKQGPLPPQLTVDYILQACEALNEAHMLGIVHRDLKPSNLYLAQRPDGTQIIKVLDFGIAKVADGAPENGMTKTNMQMGTPCYMAPEQLRSSRAIDARVDIWALGIVLYELLTGKLPFEGDSLAQIAVAVVLNPLPSIRDVRPDVPPELENVIRRCLEKERDARYPTVATLAEALAPLASPDGVASSQRIIRAANAGRPISSPSLADTMPHSSGKIPIPGSLVVPVPAQSSPRASMEKTNGAWQQETPAGTSRSRVWLAVAGAAIAGGLVVALVLRPSTPAVAEPSPAAELAKTANAPDPNASAGAPATPSATPSAIAPLPTPTAVVSAEAQPASSVSTSATSSRKNRFRPASTTVKPTPSTVAKPPKREPLPDIH